MNRAAKGVLLASISAMAFGTAPLFTATTLAEGSTPLMTLMLRNVLAIPLFYGLARRFALRMRLPGRVMGQLVLLNIFSTLTGALLFGAYPYAGIGLSTCLHFTYPVVIMLCGMVLFHDRPNVTKVAALVVAIIGIVLTVETAALQWRGIITALLSGWTYSFYVLYMDRSRLKYRNVIVVTLYSSLFNGLFAGVLALVSDNLRFDIGIKGWGAALMVALLSTTAGVALFQLSLLYIDAATAAIMCTLEPLTGILWGVLLLGEAMSVRKFIGCMCIVAGVLFVAYDNRRRSPA